MSYRKDNLMQNQYGKIEGKHCRDCCNLIEITYNSKTYFKCIAYGISQGVGTDWRKKYEACGLYNLNFEKLNKLPLIKIPAKYRIKPEELLDGQLSFYEY